MISLSVQSRVTKKPVLVIEAKKSKFMRINPLLPPAPISTIFRYGRPTKNPDVISKSDRKDILTLNIQMSDRAYKHEKYLHGILPLATTDAVNATGILALLCIITTGSITVP